MFYNGEYGITEREQKEKRELHRSKIYKIWRKEYLSKSDVTLNFGERCALWRERWEKCSYAGLFAAVKFASLDLERVPKW